MTEASTGAGAALSSGRLSFVIFSAFPSYSGGRENWLFHVLRSLSWEGHQSRVYSYQSDQAIFYDTGSLAGVEVVQVPTLRRRTAQFRRWNRASLNLGFWLDAALFVRRAQDRLLRDWAGEIVIAMNPVIDSMPALHLKQKRGAPVVCSVRGRYAWELSLRSPWAYPALRWLERRTLAQSDVVLANGLDTQDYLAGQDVQSIVVPNGVDFERFSSASGDCAETSWLRELKASGKSVVMMVGTLRGVKGTYAALEATRALKVKAGRDFVSVFVGKGEQDRYRAKARRLGIEDCVRFAGEQRDVPAFLALADVSVNVSGGAGMSMATIESMAAGKAVVAWDSRVYRQLIDHGETGLLVKEGDVEALAGAIAELMDDTGLRQRLGEAAREQARQYDWSAVTVSLLRALESGGISIRG